MVLFVFVCVFNLALALCLLYGAWQARRLKRIIGSVADKISAYERSTYKVLHQAPGAITKGQLGIVKLRQRKQQLQPQIQRVRQVLTLVKLAQQIQRQFVRTQRRQFP